MPIPMADYGQQPGMRASDAARYHACLLMFPGDSIPSLTKARRAVRWQITGGDARTCRASINPVPRGVTIWHVVNPIPEHGKVRCVDCGETFHISRGGLTESAHAAILAQLWQPSAKGNPQ